MKNDNVTKMEKLCYEAQLKVEEAGQVLCPETGEVAGVIRNKIYKAISAIEDVIHNCYMLRDPVNPFAEDTEEKVDIRFGVFLRGDLKSPAFDTEKEAKEWAEENGYAFDDDDVSIQEVYHDEDDGEEQK